MNDVCFVTCCFGDTRYYRQQLRLIRSINDTQLSTCFLIPYRNELPLGARPHWASLYGFKVHAVAEARRMTGANNIIWLDTACILQHPVDHLLKLAAERGVVAIKDDNLLENHIADKYLQQLGGPIDGVHLVGGSLYVFDFTNQKCVYVFERWKGFEEEGWFGSQLEQSSEQINKHRHDESMMALAMHLYEVEPCTHAEAKYNSGPDSIVIKQHFK